MNSNQHMSQIIARLPAELKQWLQHRAINNLRSANSELIHILKQAQNQEARQ